MTKERSSVNKAIAVTVAVFCLAVFASSSRLQEKQQTVTNTTSEKRPLLILNDNQPDSPITITSAVVEDSEEARMPTVHVTVLNNSGKRIMTYVVKGEAVLSRGTVSSSVAVINHDKSRALRPGATPEIEISGMRYSEPPQSMTLSIDFVEFIDGTRWGLDTLKNGEQLDGVRAGARAERDALMNSLMTTGMDGLLSSLDSIAPEADRSSPRSAEWLEGFRHGVGWMRERVRSKGSNVGDIEHELQSPIGLREETR